MAQIDIRTYNFTIPPCTSGGNYCHYIYGDNLGAHFKGDSTPRPRRGDRFWILMKSGRIGIYHIYSLFNHFDHFEAIGALIGYELKPFKVPEKCGNEVATKVDRDARGVRSDNSGVPDLSSESAGRPSVERSL